MKIEGFLKQETVTKTGWFTSHRHIAYIPIKILGYGPRNRGRYGASSWDYYELLVETDTGEKIETDTRSVFQSNNPNT